MIELLALVCILSMFIALLLSLVLLITRIVIVIKDKRTIKDSFLIVLIPGSIGYYYFYKHSTRLKIWYQRIVIIMFIFALIGCLFIAFINIPELAHWFFYGS